MAATITPKERKTREKKATPKSAAAARKAVASAPVAEEAPAKPARMRKGGSDKFAANQPPLKAMEDIDERVPALDEECQRAKSLKEKALGTRDELRTSLGEVGKLLHEHDLELYIHNGTKFYEEPGSPSVKMVKVKQQ